MGAAAAAVLMACAGGGGAAAYLVERSLVLRSDVSGYLTRTPSVAGNRRVGAFRTRIRLMGGESTPDDFEVKRTLFSAGTAGIDEFYRDIDGKLKLAIQGTVVLATTKILIGCEGWVVDVGCWWDTTQADPANRFGITFDGAEPVGGYSTDNRASIAQNTELHFHNNVVHYIGRDEGGGSFDGLIADPAAVDGSTTISYSVFNNAKGVRDPAQPEATWGVNGFWLKLDDNSAATAGALGKDSSGNGNNFTPVNVTVDDSIVDSPSDFGVDTGAGGEVRGCYAVLSPLEESNSTMNIFTSQGRALLSQGNLKAIEGSAIAPLPLVGGPYYFEAEVLFGDLAPDLPWEFGIGVGEIDAILGSPTAPFSMVCYFHDGNGFNPDTGLPVPIGEAWEDGDIIGVYADPANGEVRLYLNNSLQETRTHLTPGVPLRVGVVSNAELNGFVLNFGQRPFVYTPPAGAKVLCSRNFPAGSIRSSGSFVGSGLVEGHAVWLNGMPTSMTINGNAVTWGVEALRSPTGITVITDDPDYNDTESPNTYSVSAGVVSKYARMDLQ